MLLLFKYLKLRSKQIYLVYYHFIFPFNRFEFNMNYNLLMTVCQLFVHTSLAIENILKKDHGLSIYVLVFMLVFLFSNLYIRPNAFCIYFNFIYFSTLLSNLQFTIYTLSYFYHCKLYYFYWMPILPQFIFEKLICK